MKISRDRHNHLCLGQNYEVNLIRLVEDELINSFNAKRIASHPGIDTSYWDYDVEGTMIVLHYEHYTGVYLIPGYFFDLQKMDHKLRADNIIDRIEEHFKTIFSSVQTS